jgi:hypothetical protein
MSEVATTSTNEQGLAEFNKLKASIDDQIKNLSLIKVNDDTSMAVANQQLSKAKQLIKTVNDAHALVKEEALRFCQSADKAKREMANPLIEAMGLTESELLAYNRKVEADKKAELDRLEKEKEKLRKEAEDTKQALIKQMKEFEARAFTLINDATNPAQLSFVYTKYIQEFPAVYDVNIKDRISKLGKAKLDVMNAPGSEKEEVYSFLYDELTGTVRQIIAPVVLQPSFDAIEVKKSVIEKSSTPSNIKKTWKHEVVTLEAVPMGWLLVDESKVKAFIKENSDKFTEGEIINGIRYFLESSVKIK